MTQTKSIDIKCLSCNSWFPSPISFGDIETFDDSVMIGNEAQCPKCNKITQCNKENMRVRANDGGFQGNDTF